MRTRPTVRLLLLDGQQRLLLFQYEDAVALDPTTPELRVYWVTPGGGVEPGETFEQAGLRELWEETGIRGATLGPWVWHRERVLYFSGEMVRFDERYYLVAVPDTAIDLRNLLAHEQVTYRDHRWWSLTELRADAQRHQTGTPACASAHAGVVEFLAGLLFSLGTPKIRNRRHIRTRPCLLSQVYFGRLAALSTGWRIPDSLLINVNKLNIPTTEERPITLCSLMRIHPFTQTVSFCILGCVS